MITEITNACRGNLIRFQACETLGMSIIYRPTNQSAKPPSEGVLLSWRLDHERAHTTSRGRAYAAPLKRTTQRRTTKRRKHKASLAVMPHNQNRTHDGQEWPELGHSLPASQSGQE